MNTVLKAGIASVVLFATLFGVMNLFEHLDSRKILVVQSLGGTMNVYSTPGYKPQMFGGITTYPKRAHYDFEMPVRFNDNGTGKITGSLDYDLPVSNDLMINLHQQYGSPEAINDRIIQKVVNKAVYSMGSLMTSKEASAEKRNDMIRYVDEQIQNGVFRTKTVTIEVSEPNGQMDEKNQPILIKKNVTEVHIVEEKGAPNGLARQEKSTITEFGIKTFNFSISKIDFDEVVEKQIKEQQVLQMQVQKSIAEAKTAEQRAITIAKQGEATAAEARWKQETIKAQAVTKAEQERDVAKLEKDAAEFTKQKLILEGQGEAEKKRLVMQADGALTQKLAAYIEVNKAYASAIQNAAQPLTPSVVTGGSSNGGNAATQMLEYMGVKAARDLSLDTGMKNSK